MYKPKYPDDGPDPGEIVWARVHFEDKPNEYKDRPVLVIGRVKGGTTLAAVQLTSQPPSRRDEISIGSGPWDRQDRPSSVKLGRIVQIDEGSYRREGAIVSKPLFDKVVGAVKQVHARGVVAACYSAACRPPTSGGTGGSSGKPSGSTLVGNVQRVHMPQIKGAKLGEFEAWLGTKGVTSTARVVNPSTLKATQTDFDMEKVAGMVKSQGTSGAGSLRSPNVLVSNDGFILDGHHRWLAAKQTGTPIPVRQYNASIDQLVDHAHKFVAQDQLKKLFPNDEPQVIAPWPKTGRTKGKPLFDPQKVVEAVQNPVLHDVDPTTLKSTQGWVTRAGVAHYLTPEYDRTGKVFADADQPTNRYPVVLRRANGDNVILSGHHRAAAALVSGKPLRAILVDE